jgi:hypothetical protein
VPFIHIKSLPPSEPLDVGVILEGFSRDFAEEVGIGLQHVHATWEFLQPRHYAVAGKVRDHQPSSSHPILVELLSPDFNDAKTIEAMLNCVASSLAKRARVPRSNIFINHRQARSGMVFDAGSVERW